MLVASEVVPADFYLAETDHTGGVTEFSIGSVCSDDSNRDNFCCWNLHQIFHCTVYEVCGGEKNRAGFPDQRIQNHREFSAVVGDPKSPLGQDVILMQSDTSQCGGIRMQATDILSLKSAIEEMLNRHDWQGLKDLLVQFP